VGTPRCEEEYESESVLVKRQPYEDLNLAGGKRTRGKNEEGFKKSLGQCYIREKGEKRGGGRRVGVPARAFWGDVAEEREGEDVARKTKRDYDKSFFKNSVRSAKGRRAAGGRSRHGAPCTAGGDCWWRQGSAAFRVTTAKDKARSRAGKSKAAKCAESSWK